MMTNITPKSTKWTFLSIHQPAHHQEAPQRSREELKKEYLEEAKVKADEKNYTATDHLALEPSLCKATFNVRLRRISVFMKGTLLINNISILYIHNVNVASCQVHIKGY